ncbi:chymotrypsin inhibitor-like [Odontomachus brunneus]|uniref:chymotrypsin inhibitor-like n=1 Tax=Odontomachus brunneus TaxID=486640 RepID=UPI0013F28667|nr:chymotrypsin inhibitor-like [Odontomachus brunneus]
MSRNMLVLFLFVAIVATVMSNKKVKPVDKVPIKCGKNEVFNKCGPVIQPSCDNLKPKNCEKKCVKGCFCIEGMVRNAKNECIRPCECDC